jgi:hypothetical protein
VGNATTSSITADTSQVTADKAKIAANKQKMAALRKQLLDLSKPGPQTVQKLEDQISQTEADYRTRIDAASAAKIRWDQSSTPRELQLEQAVITAQKGKLASSTLTTIDRLKQAVLNAEETEQAYIGKNTAIKKGNTLAVDQARDQYSQYILSQAPVKAAVAGAVSTADLNLREYLQSEKPTQQQLEAAIQNLQIQEKSVIDPLDTALVAAKIAQSARAQRVKQQSFDLRQKIQTLTNTNSTLTSKDTSLSTKITGLKAILSGANGGTGTTAVDPNISLFESLAAQLGSVEWGAGGVFQGVNTANQGLAYVTETDILSLQNDIAASQTAAGSASSLAADDSQLISLLEEQNAILAETVAVNVNQTAALMATVPGIPSFDAGGPILDDTLANVHKGEYVVPRGGALVMNATGGGGATLNHQTIVQGDMAGLIRVVDSRILHPNNVMAVSRQIGRRSQLLSGAPGRR